MKKIPLLFLILFLSQTGVKAQYTFSQLNIRLTDSTAFIMSVDDVSYNYPSNVFNVNLLPGLHLIKVMRTGAVPSIIFDGLIEMPYNTKVYATIDYMRNFRVHNLMPYNYNTQLYPENNIDISTAPTKGMNHLAFYNLKMRMFNSNTSLEKMKIAKSLISQNQISSGQLAEVIKIIEFEAHRIELAKYAYPFTVDKLNYSVIYESLSFESSVSELNKFVEDKAKSEEKPLQK